MKSTLLVRSFLLAWCAYAGGGASACSQGGGSAPTDFGAIADDSGVAADAGSGRPGSERDSSGVGFPDSSGSSDGLAGGPPGSAGAVGHYYASPTGTGTSCSSTAPCSITQAQAAVRSAAGQASTDLVVELSDGVYPLANPLVFTAADAAANGHTVAWQAAPNAHPILSGGRPITGWTVSDSGKNIWKASAPGSFATRQLYVNDVTATRARSTSISRSQMTITTNGWTFSTGTLSYLNNLARAQRAELNIIGSWTNRYSPIQSVAN
ncbi:MAG: hypothetical protein ACREOE_20295, partial [Gemmatimonadales bacterium]